MNNQISSKLKKRAVAVAVASCLSFTPWLAEAAGLGKITILSGLGQPLRAELEVNATREELVGMAAKLAPVDAFRQAGIDYASVLSDLRFSIDKGTDGKQVVKITSAKPVNEPFLDFLVELNWSSGRLVREYTFLLDPPEIASKTPGRPLSVVEAKPVKTLAGGTVAVESAPKKPVEDAPKQVAKPAPAPVPKSEAAPKSTDSAQTHLTKSGETLGKIAAATKMEGVSLEQMLVGLYQNNPDAFIGKNLNRLKSGAILSIPDKAVVEAIPEAEAKKILLTQSSDWNAYRQKLSTAATTVPVRDEAASQQATGKITAKVEEKSLPLEQSKDQVKVSRSEQAGKSAATSGAAEEDRVAKERALKEASERLAQLEKNVNDLQKLVDLKNQKLAELQQQSASKPEEAKPTPTAPAPAVKEEVKPPVEEAKPKEATPAPEKPAEPAPLPEPKPAPKPVPPPPPPPPLVEDEGLLGEPLILGAAGGIIALLLGFFLHKRRRSVAPVETTAMAVTPSGLGANSVFRMTGGQSVDTGNTAPQTGDFSQTGPGTIDTDEVDPVAEADVYMAYGRDAQAEEILLEALQKDPQRTAIHAKLLEIYANRQSLKQFETLASELYAQTAGIGPEWEKVAALGARLDPANPLYGGSLPGIAAVAAASAFDADATMVVTPAQPVESPAREVSFELPKMEDELPEDEELITQNSFVSTVVKEPVEETFEEELKPEDLTGLDFDLGNSITAAEPPVQAEGVSEDDADTLDFDLDMVASEPVSAQETVKIEDAGLMVDLPAEPEAETPDFSPEGTLVMSSPLNIHAAADEDLLEPVSVRAEDLSVDVELDAGTETIVNPAALMQDIGAEPLAPEVDASAPEELRVDSEPQVQIDDIDADSLEFDMKLTDSTILGQPMSPAGFDISSINLDLAANEAVAEPEVALPTESPLPDAGEVEAEASGNVSVDAAVREEINTKLDLAKAYEEMGDLEGARELLAEVAAEGPPDLAGEAKEILARIG